MNVRQLKKLKSDLLKFQGESINIDKHKDLVMEIQAVITAINKELERPTKAKKNDIDIIIHLIDNGDVEKINRDFSKINFVSLEKTINSKIDISSLSNYTILQLKVIYYMLTHDSENNAIKTNKKMSVLNSVKEVIFNNMRTQKLENK